MEIVSIKHKALQNFAENRSIKGLPANISKHLSRAIKALDEAEDLDELATLPHWRIHELHGSRRGDWSMYVTGKWRLVFRIVDGKVHDLILEDYHAEN